jgi:hypothetical protein
VPVSELGCANQRKLDRITGEENMHIRLTSTIAAMALISTSVLGTNAALGDEKVTPLLKQTIQDGME